MKRKIATIMLLLTIMLASLTVVTACGNKNKTIAFYDADSLLWTEFTVIGESYEAKVAEKNGYAFLGWFSDKELTARKTDETGASINAYDGSYTNLYASFRAYDIVVTIDEAGGTLSDGVSKQLYFKYGETITESLPVPTKSGYVFDGWQGKNNRMITDSLGAPKKESCVVDSENLTILENMTAKIVALYSLRKVEISFDALGGKIVDNITAEMFSSIMAFPVTARSNYFFAGWKISATDVPVITFPFKITPEMSDKITLIAEFIKSDEADSLIYNLINEERGYEVSFYSETLSALTIPDIYNDLPILRVKRVSMPNLKNILIPSTVTEIGANAFADCNSLERVSLPASILKIGDCAFSGLTALESVVLPNGIKEVGKNVFKDSHSLCSVNLPLSVTSLGSGAFAGTSPLLKIDVPKTSTSFKFEDGILYKNNSGELTILHYVIDGRSIITPSFATRAVADFAFYNADKVKTIHFPDVLKSIGNGAFWGMSSLISLQILGEPEIGAEAFKDCVSLKALSLSAKYPRAIGENAFGGCKEHLSIFVPDDALKAYREDSAWNQYSLSIFAVSDNYNGFILRRIDSDYCVVNYVGTDSKIIVPKSVNGISVTSISGAFIGMSDITEVTLGENVSKIDENSFKGCVSLKSIIFLGISPPNLHENAFAGASSDFIIYTLNDMTVYDKFFNSPAFYTFVSSNRLKTL